MTLERARELVAMQTQFGGGYNRNATKLILAELYRDAGQQSVDKIIVEHNLEALFGFKPGTRFTT